MPCFVSLAARSPTLFVWRMGFLTGKAAELHLAFFQLLPGFSGMDIGSWILGTISVAL